MKYRLRYWLSRPAPKLAARLIIVFFLAISSAVSQEVATFDAGFENHSNLTFSPDGAHAWWVEWDGNWGAAATRPRRIYTSTLQSGVWSPSREAPFSGDFADDDPFVSPDGRWLYFTSERPTTPDDEIADANIWRYDLNTPGDPQLLAVNSAATEFSPVVTASGTLFFASDRADGIGQGDLYRATASGDTFLAPELLGPAVNSSTGEWNLWISADESELIFEASSRTSNVAVPGDLYVSWNTSAGWTAALPVSPLNSSGSDLLPRLAPGSERLFYTTAPLGGQARIVDAEWSEIRTELRTTYAPVLLVANRASHEVTFVDLLQGEVMRRLPTGEGPHLLSNVSMGEVAATGFGEFPEPHATPVDSRPPFVSALNSRLSVFDAVNQSVLLQSTIEQCARPHASWIVGERIFVTCQDEGDIAELDLKSGATIRRHESLQDGSHVLSYEPDSRTLAVSNTGSGSVTLLNLENASTKVVQLAPGSEGALADAGKFWVANGIEGSIAIVEAATGTVIELTDPVCGFPIAFSKSSSGQIWLACFASRELLAFDADTLELVRRIELADQPLNILAHPQRELVYLSLPRKNAVVEIDLLSGEEVRRIMVGIEPDGLRWATPD